MSLNLRQELVTITAALDAEAIDYALCGGLALAAHGFPRATQDIDLLIDAGDLNRAEATLEKQGYILKAGIIPFDAGTEKERRVFRISKGVDEDLLTLDLILVSEALREAWESRESVRVGDATVQVVSLAGLKQMKRLAGRMQDLADLAQLEGG